MSIKLATQTIALEDGRTISIESGKLAKQADGSVLLRMGDTVLLATVVSNKKLREGMDFFPLSVDYKEKYPADGRFPGGFIKREARPNDLEILTCRLVDRALRPLFNDDYKLETQVMISLLSLGKDDAPDALACFAASAAIAASDIPFNGPVSEVRVGRVDGKLILNPTYTQIAESDLDMVIAATMKDIMMVEGEMKEISEEDMIEVIKFAHEAIKVQCQAQLDLAAQIEATKVKRDYVKPETNEELNATVSNAIYDELFAIAAKGSEKHERTASFNAVFDEYKATLSEDELAANGQFLGTAFNKAQKKAVRDCVLKNGTRLDGRATDKIRDIWSEVDYLPSPHGSSVFTRGETQSLTTVTIGTKMDKQRMDAVSESREDQFYLHYNFPPYSTGEAYPIRGTSRREVGHGNLAQRALKGVLPTGEDFPYTVRVVSDILESNGSSSMATVCAGSMALMDAGVQVSGGVSGIAMGLIYDNDTKEYAVLSDILGDEDHLGDMDFKVAGTKKGITATQMDIKIDGLSYELLTKALFQSKEGRLHILSEMEKTIVDPQPEFKPHAPRIVSVIIPSDFIGAIIGPGGKVIQEMQKETNTTIALEENEGKDTATVTIAGVNKEDIDAAVAKVKSIATVLEAGEVYKGKVKAVLAFGAIIEVLPGKEGLLHISEIAHRRVEDVSKEFSEGDIVEVKVLGIDAKSGKIKLSKKALLPKPEKSQA